MYRRKLISIVLVSFPLAAAVAGEVHEHGAARLDVAVEGNALSLRLESPLDNLLGFERAPRTDEERERARLMAKRLHGAEQVFVPTTEARCVLKSVKLSSAVLDAALLEPARDGSGHVQKKHKHKHDHKHDHDHAELMAETEFECAAPERLVDVKIDLFDAFPRFERLDVQLIAPSRQMGARLTPAQRTLSWSR